MARLVPLGPTWFGGHWRRLDGVTGRRGDDPAIAHWLPRLPEVGVLGGIRRAIPRRLRHSFRLLTVTRSPRRMAFVQPSFSPPRCTSEPLPPYAYTPGRFPHPVRDPQGHSFGRPPPSVSPTELADWRTSRVYRVGVDLFNHGYYWEAHEAWEALWNALGRRGVEADF